MIRLDDYEQETGTEPVVLALKAALLVRNARQSEPLEGVYKDYEKLRKSVLKLKMAVTEREREIVLLRGARMDGKALESMQESLLKLTNEMCSGMESQHRSEESAREQLRLMRESEDLRQQLGIVSERLGKLQEEHGESLSLAASVEAEVKLSGASEERLKLELVSLRKLLAVAENDAEVAQSERDNQLFRTMKEKQLMMDQINELNAEVTKLKGPEADNRNISHHRHPKPWRPRWKSLASSLSNLNHTHEDEVIVHKRNDEDEKKKTLLAPTVESPVPNRCLCTFLHTEGQRVNDCTYSESLLTTASNDGSILVWNHPGVRGFQAWTSSYTSNSEVSSSCGTAIPLCSIIVGDILIGGCSDDTVRLWNYKTSRKVGQLTGHSQRVTCLTPLECLGNGPYIATGSSDCSIRIFDVALVKAVNKLTMRAKSKCTGLAGIDGGSPIVSGHMDGSLRFWDSRTSNRIHSTSALHAGRISGLDVADGSRTLLTCGQDNRLKVLDTRTYSVIATLTHGSFVVSRNCGKPAISNDGRLAVVGSARGVVYVWDVSTNRSVAQLECHKTPVVACSWSSTIPRLASCDTSGTVVVWE